MSGYLIHDRDTKFTARFRDFWKSEKIRSIRAPVRAPPANGFAESCIGVFKKKCLNHFLCVSLDQLDCINHEWLSYYNNGKPHQGTDIGNKALRPDV